MVLFMMLYALQLVKHQDLAGAPSPSAPATTVPANSLALAAELSQRVRQGDIELTETSCGTEIAINAGILFNASDTRRRPQSRRVFHKVATALRPSKHKILVEEHRDSVPIASSKYESNGELSSTRADTVPAALGDSTQARQEPPGHDPGSTLTSLRASTRLKSAHTTRLRQRQTE